MSPFGISFEFSFLFFHFPLLILSLNGSVRASWLREGAGGKPARAQAVGTQGGKKATLEALFASLRPHGLCPRTWNRASTPSAARGHAQEKNIIL